MKKLMFAAAIAAGLCATESKAVESGIVGYGPTSYTDGEGQMIPGVCSGASFKKVGGGLVDLATIKVTGYTKEGGQGGTMGVQVQTLDAGGGTDRTYMFIDYTDGEETMGPGWFDPDNDYAPLEENDIMLADGEGLWTVISEEGLSLQTSGEVATTEDVPTDVPQSRGGVVLVNPTPVRVDLNKCYVDGYTKEGGQGGTMGIQVQTLDAGGGTDRTYMFIDYTEGEETMGPGWFDPDNDYAPLEDDDIVLEPGTGLWSVISEPNLIFYWPKVELTK